MKPQLISTDIALTNRGTALDASIQGVIGEICAFSWKDLKREDLISVAWIYYYFSVHFCESVGDARELFPDDAALEELDRGERNTDNLSPCAGVVAAGERVDHCEFMRRTLQLEPIAEERRMRLEAIGEAYLAKARAADPESRARGLVSYEDGGLEAMFCAILDAQHWDGPLLGAFKHFLVGHIELDSDPDHGHGSLCRHLRPNWEAYSLWVALRDGFLQATPSLTREVAHPRMLTVLTI
jgi:hypothetical protein